MGFRINRFLHSSKNRKGLHFALIYSIILVLVFILLLIYNEIVNEKKLKHLYEKLFQYDTVLKDLNTSESELVEAQNALLYFVSTNNPAELEKYHKNISQVHSGIERIQTSLNNEPNLALVEDDTKSKVNTLQQFLQKTNPLQPIENYQIPKDIKSKIVNDVLLNTHLEMNKSVDSVQKKGLFGRLNDAVKGKNEVQVEKTEMVVTYRYGSKVETGTLNQYVTHSVQNALNLYEKQLFALERNQEKLTQQQRKYLQNNDSIVHYSRLIFDQYHQNFSKAKDALKISYDKQYVKNRLIRRYTVLGMLVLVLVIVGASLLLTRLTYQFEEEIRIAKEKLRDNLKFKNRIVSMLSHEVRSPLQMISILSKRIGQQLTSDKIQKNLQSVDFTVNSILLLTQQILTYSKSEHQNQVLNWSTIPLSSEIEQLLHAFQPYIESKNIRLETQTDIHPDIKVQADVPKLHQLYYNILGNAVKFTQNGTIRVKSKTTPLQNDVLFEVEIEDNGSGMSKEDLNVVMSPYQQGQNALQQHQNLGIGLGLYLCKEIVELHQGSIHVESELNQGTKVKFVLPLKIVKH